MEHIKIWAKHFETDLKNKEIIFEVIRQIGNIRTNVSYIKKTRRSKI